MAKTYTVKQVAKLLGFSTNTIYKYLDEGKIKAIRLGKESRFRIPEAEVLRLLGSKGALYIPESGDQAPKLAGNLESFPATEKEEIEFREVVGEISQELNHQAVSPDLFDWFLSLVAIFLGVVYFLFPIAQQTIVFEPYRNLLFVIKMSLIPFGIALMLVDLFTSTKKHYHLAVRIPLGLAFLGLTYIYFSTRELFTASFFIPFVLFTFVSIFWHRQSPLKFIIFVYLLIGLGAVAFVKNPQPLIFADIRPLISLNPLAFQLLSIAGATVLFVITLFAYLKSTNLYYSINIFLTLIFFAISINFITTQAWNRSVISLLTGSFLILIPFHKHLASLASFTRRQVIVSFSWMVAAVLAGVIIVYFIQASYRNLILNENQKRVQTAAESVRKSTEDTIRFNSTLAKSENLVVFLSSFKKDTKASKEKIEELEKILKNASFSLSTVRRIIVYDEEGDFLALYPPLENTSRVVVNIADREYFQEAKNKKRDVISTALVPKVSDPSIPPIAIYIASPVVDQKDNVIGVIASALNFSKIVDDFSDIEFGDIGSFTVADVNKTIFIDKDPSLLGRQAKLNSNLIAAVNGQSGQKEGYDEQGDLSLQAFTHIDTFGWGIVAQQRYADAFRSSSLVAFSIFLVTILAGVGTLIATMYISKKHL